MIVFKSMQTISENYLSSIHKKEFESYSFQSVRNWGRMVTKLCTCNLLSSPFHKLKYANWRWYNGIYELPILWVVHVIVAVLLISCIYSMGQSGFLKTIFKVKKAEHFMEKCASYWWWVELFRENPQIFPILQAASGISP